MNQTKLVEALKSFYAEMESSKLNNLSSFYHQEIAFADPVHQVNGLEQVKDYLENSIKNVDYCHFNFTDELFNDEGGYLSWQMSFAHPKLNDGAEIVVPGVTHLKFAQGESEDESTISEHTDYYDMGALVYEHVPVMGWLTSKVKDRMKN